MDNLTGLEAHSLHSRQAEIRYWLRRGSEDKWVIFLHGACTDHRSFDHQLAGFDRTYNLLLVDQRGQGLSTMQRGKRIEFTDMVDDVLQLIRRYAIHQTILIAHSFSCYVAQEFAFLHPARVSRMVLIGCYDHHKKQYPVALSEFARVTLTGLLLLLPWGLMANFAARVSSRDPATRARLRRQLIASGRRTYWQLGSSARRAAHYVEYYDPPHPTLLIRGEFDYPNVLATITDQMIARNPLARQAIISGVGHMCHEEAAAVVNPLIADFLS